MFQNLTGWHALIVLAVILLVFGAAKLPALARSVGESVRILRSESASSDPQAAEPASAAPTEPAAADARVASTPASDAASDREVVTR
ncbi:twin-arginine translocase TatA/TatE family subunit [Homoserinibacter sp. GY 40078]|uniref:Sec-independent protein translocase subunit TatA/TatB n=1 Tax=Homoserinibacter sp. GY 40078 TaxID=2603275 RepID=UPI0011C7332A|nr:twin-arginine translocase TatA/TatE family subunit [Homoserinibacter sp. GY 40078]TXK19038.1 Sec-independent protein translocase TatA [Homoserinibacter sp. GY 40078]